MYTLTIRLWQIFILHFDALGFGIVLKLYTIPKKIKHGLKPDFYFLSPMARRKKNVVSG
jgi:hypothetical protein